MSDETPWSGDEFAIGSQVAGYRLDEEIGRGGMAVVYRAHDPRLDRRVALKILAPGLARDEEFRQRFIRESRAAAAVDHPHIIPVFGAGEAEGVLFIAMRYVEGRDARTLIDQEGPLPAAVVAGIINQVAAALDSAHAHGLVHRDVKPANMLLDSDAGTGPLAHVYLSDFGLSKQALSSTNLTATGQFLGTLDYVAPEQIEGRAVSGRADQYALACAAFEMLAGIPPFQRDQRLAVMWAQLSEPPPALTASRPDLPPAVDQVMAKALAKSPDDRYDRCVDFAAALRAACGLGSGAASGSGRTTPEQPAGAPEPGRAGPGRDDQPPAGPTRPATEAAGPTRPATEAAGPTRPATEISRPSRRPRELPRPAWGPAAAVGGAGPASAGTGSERSGSDHPAGSPTDAGGAQGGGTPGGGTGGGSAGGDWPPPSGAGQGQPTQAGYRPSRESPPPGGPPPPAAGGRGDRPRWRSPAVLVIVVVLVLGLAGAAYAFTRGGRAAAALKPPGCTTKTASAQSLHKVKTRFTAVPGKPFAAAVTPDGHSSFATLGSANAIAVLQPGRALAPTFAQTIPVTGKPQGAVVTPNGRYLLAATGSGATVINVNQAVQGSPSAVAGTLTSPGGGGAVEVAVSRDGRFAFVTLQDNGTLVVFNLHAAIAGGFASSHLVGTVRLGYKPTGMTVTADGKWLYVTTQRRTQAVEGGTLSLISMQKAETKPASSVVATVSAGCDPVRVITTSGGQNVWVTARGSNYLLGFSAAKLRSNPSHALIARVQVGQSPIGLTALDNGKRIIVANSNMGLLKSAKSSLAVIDTTAALAGKAALIGLIRSHLVPRQFSMENGRTLLVTNSSSQQVEAVDVTHLP